MIFVFFICAFNFFCNVFSQIVFDFEKKYKTFNKDNFSDYISNNKLITKITLGTPKQEIPFEIDFKEHYFYITDKIVNGIYDSTISSSYINTSKSNSYGFDNIKECYTSFEYFYFNNYTKKEFLSKNDFLLITKTKKQNDEELSKLGLTIISYMEFYKYNLLYILKQNKTINSIIFYFEYLKDSKGKLYIGTEPHNIQKNMFSNQNYQTKYLDFSDSINWLFNFNNISFYNISITSYRQIKFDANFNGIFPPTNIKEEIKEKAFNKLIEDKICSIESNDKFEYSFFVCEKNFEIEKFQSLSFYLKDFNFTFTLTYEDLFIKNNNRYYCLILYEDKTLFGRVNWVIGEVFLKKYFIVFNQEKQMIGFYTKLNTSSINLPISWILVFIFVTISLILAIIVYKLLNQKKRKIRANELEDDIEYVQKI